jgi:hypothetical protein
LEGWCNHFDHGAECEAPKSKYYQGQGRGFRRAKSGGRDLIPGGVQQRCFMGRQAGVQIRSDKFRVRIIGGLVEQRIFVCRVERKIALNWLGRVDHQVDGKGLDPIEAYRGRQSFGTEAREHGGDQNYWIHRLCSGSGTGKSLREIKNVPKRDENAEKPDPCEIGLLRNNRATS